MSQGNSTATPQPKPQWPDVSKPDTRGGGNGTQSK